MAKLILVILDGVGYAKARAYLGNLEAWVNSGEARVWKMLSVVPSVSGPCYVSMHTGILPATHGILTNYDHLRRVEQPDIFSAASAAGKITAAVAHSFFSIYFQRAPFDPVRDLEIDDPQAPIQHARFYTMASAHRGNLAVPCDRDLLAQATMLGERFAADYILFHTCSPDSIGHKYGQDSIELDTHLYQLDAALAVYLPRWRAAGYEIVLTADHGQTARGHHGGSTAEMREVPLYYFGAAAGPAQNEVLCQTQLAPGVLRRLGVAVPETMAATPLFL